ncbi:hypothetical protein LCGC14_3012470 [marine sediment metagenome]|uniref:Uncharacterized protein n=1 Tax=marine sediment metagenome TaxID=412755 RepID=A0A0F8XKK5_9ZZZZ
MERRDFLGAMLALFTGHLLPQPIEETVHVRFTESKMVYKVWYPKISTTEAAGLIVKNLQGETEHWQAFDDCVSRALKRQEGCK